MGMQCNFKANDRPEFVTMGVCRHFYDDSELDEYFTAEFQDDNGNVLEVNYSPQSDSCWFDIGGRSPDQMAQLDCLIMWRIPFTCA